MKRRPAAKLIDSAFPRSFLVATLTMADEYLVGAIDAIATGDVPKLREQFNKFIASTKAATETLADAIKQIEEER